MSYSKYYKLLGLPENASQDEIRRKYRKLALQYHPDKNPDPYAQALFVQITEAYSVLMGKSKIPSKKIYATPNNTRESRSQNRADKTKEERIKEAQERYKQQKEEQERQEAYFYERLFQGKKWRFFKTIAWSTFTFCLILFIDLNLPHQIQEDQITGFNVKDIGASNPDLILINTQKGDNFFVTRRKSGNQRLTTDCTKIHIEKTPILHLPFKMHSIGKTSVSTYIPAYTFGQTYPYFVILLLIPMISYIFRRKNIAFVIFYMISLQIVPVIFVFILFGDFRILHLLTFGLL